MDHFNAFKFINHLFNISIWVLIYSFTLTSANDFSTNTAKSNTCQNITAQILHCNDIISLPKNGDSITDLDITNANIDLISILDYPNLRRLKLESCILSDADFFVQNLCITSQKINEITIRNCSVQKFDVETLNVCKSLMTLNLSRNIGINLWTQDGNPIDSELKVLDMSQCGIEFLKMDVFKSLPNLEVLKLNGNKLTSLPCGMKKVMEKLRIVEVSDMDVKCKPSDLNDVHYNIIIDSCINDNCTQPDPVPDVDEYENDTKDNEVDDGNNGVTILKINSIFVLLLSVFAVY